MSLKDSKAEEKYIDNIEEHQYLTFIVNDDNYGIKILSVKEIITYGSVTKVPSTMNFIEGVTNVRGNIIPVISLSRRFGFEKQKITNKTCIIIISQQFESEIQDIGIVADRVNQVYDILPINAEDTPDFGTKINKKFIDFIGKVNGKFITILDNSKVLDVDELANIMEEKRAYRRRIDDKR